VRGKRCLDVGTSDGFLAFELERRGAAAVLAADIVSHEDWDWEPEVVHRGLEYLHAVFGPDVREGFHTAARLLGSRVEFSALSVYDLDPAAIGTFDVVVCGSLLLHLRDPLRALAAIHSVCAGELLCTNQIDLRRSIGPRRAPLVRLDGSSGVTQWWVPNAAGHRQMIRAAGFDLERESPLYSLPFGPAHPPRAREPKERLRGLAERVLTGNPGVPHLAVLARRRQRTGAP
jgi:tRNA (mo5U34)-methyltransferase